MEYPYAPADTFNSSMQRSPASVYATVTARWLSIISTKTGSNSSFLMAMKTIATEMQSEIASAIIVSDTVSATVTPMTIVTITPATAAPSTHLQFYTGATAQQAILIIILLSIFGVGCAIFIYFYCCKSAIPNNKVEPDSIVP